MLPRLRGSWILRSKRLKGEQCKALRKSNYKKSSSEEELFYFLAISQGEKVLTDPLS
jgi:hypothetical protein